MLPVYFSKEETAIFKGLAIILIVLGHNPNWRSPEHQEFLYSFHIYAFFILPFFYKRKISGNTHTLLKTFIRCMTPYFWFYSLNFLVTNVLFKHNDCSLNIYLMGLFNILGKTPGSVCESVYLWFLPSYFWLIVFWFLGERYRVLKGLFLFLSAFLSIDATFTWQVAYYYVPFYIARGLYYYVFACATVSLVKIFREKSFVCGVVVFALLCFIYVVFGYSKVYSLIMPIAGFLSIRYLSRHLKSVRLLSKMGNLSIIIYLFHMYFYYVIDQITDNKMLLYLSTIIALFGSYLLSLFVKRCVWLDKMLFPSKITFKDGALSQKIV